jgi:hypothetical protein
MRVPSPFKLFFLFALMVGLFVFPMNSLLRAETVPAPADTSASGELVFWNTIKKSENAADFEVYLKTFPDGMFAEIAQTRYKELGGTAAVAAPGVEEPAVAEPEVKEAVMAEPEPDAVVKTRKPPKKAAVVYETKPKKRAASVFAKKKKTKVILAYTKERAKKKSRYAATKPSRKYVKKPQQPVVVKAKYAKPKAVKKKIYADDKEPASGTGGGGGGGSGGGGGGWSGGGG